MDVNGRIAWVEIARVFATFLVVTLHLMAWFDVNVSTINRALFLRAHVPFFFIISAYFYTNNFSSAPNKFRFAKKRITEMLIPFLLFNLIALPFSYKELYTNGSFDFIFMFSKMFGIMASPADIPLWFLRDLMLFFILTPLVLKLNQVILFTLALALFAFPNLITCPYSLPAPEYFGYYCLGIFFARQNVSLKAVAGYIAPYAGKILVAVLLVNAIVIYMQLKGFQEHDHDIYWKTLNVPARMLGVLGIMSVSLLILRYWKKGALFFARYGTEMFFVYVTHNLVIGYFTVLQGRLDIYLPHWPAVVLMELCPFVIMFGTVFAVQKLRKIFPVVMKYITLSKGVPSQEKTFTSARSDHPGP